MIRAVTGWSLRFRLLVLGIAGAAMLYGYTQLPNVPLDVTPEFTPPYVEIQTEALGLSADEVEQLITVPLEADLLHGVAFLDEIHSESVAGLSSIVLVFEPGTDIFRARQVVAERLTQAHALPNVSRPSEMLQPLASASRVLMVSLTSDDVSLIDMSVLARWTIRPRLMGVPGVANVAIWGQRERQLQVLVDPERLRNERIALAHVIETAGNALWVSPLSFLDASTPGTGGFIDTANQRLGVQHILPIRSPEDLAEVPIAPEDTGGRIVRLGDIATVVEDHQPLIGDAIVGDGSGLLLVVEKFPGTNTLDVTRGVEAALEAMKPGLTGIEIDTEVYRPATFIEEAIATLSLALAVGLVLFAVILLALRLDWRRAAVSLVAVPLSLAAAALVLYLAGATVNAISVAGLVLAIAVLVDDAVTGTDGLLGRLRGARAEADDRSRDENVLAATQESRGVLVFATLIVLMTAAPVFFLAGTAGAFLPPLITAYLLAVGASFVVALTVVPALVSLLAARGAGDEGRSVLPRIEPAYVKLLGRALRAARPVFAAAVVVAVVAVAAGAAAVPRIGDSLAPTLRERDLLVQWEGAPGTSHPEMRRIVARVSDELRAQPGVRSVGAHVGRAITSDQVVSINSGELWVSIEPTADYERTVEDVAAVVDGYPGLGRAITTYSSARIGEVLGAAEDDVVVRVYGQELPVLREKAAQIQAAITGIAGIRDTRVESQVLEPTVEIEVDLERAQQYGIKAGDVRRAATTLLSGVQVGSLFEEQKVFEVVVWGAPEIRQSVTSVGDLLIQAPGGPYVRLADVADIRVAPAPSVIRREGVFRRIDVSATVDGRDIGSVIADVETRLASIEFPLEYHAEIRGLAAERQEATIQVLGIVGAALVGVLLLLQAALGSWRRATILLVTVPAALVGGIVGAVAAGGVSIGALAGLFAVLAIAVRQAVVLADRCLRLEREDGARFGADLVARAAASRLGAVLTTGLATAGALGPVVLLGGGAGLEIVGPMAAVILAGLVTSTLLVLFIVPAGILVAGPSPEPDPATLLADQPGFSPI